MHWSADESEYVVINEDTGCVVAMAFAAGAAAAERHLQRELSQPSNFLYIRVGGQTPFTGVKIHAAIEPDA